MVMMTVLLIKQMKDEENACVIPMDRSLSQDMVNFLLHTKHDKAWGNQWRSNWLVEHQHSNPLAVEV